MPSPSCVSIPSVNERTVNRNTRSRGTRNTQHNRKSAAKPTVTRISPVDTRRLSMTTKEFRPLEISEPATQAAVSSVPMLWAGPGMQSNHDRCTTFPFESTVKVLRQVCIHSLSFQSVSHVSTLPPLESAAVRSGAPHNASSRDSGTPTQPLMTSFLALVVAHALDRNTSATAAMWRGFTARNDLSIHCAANKGCALSFHRVQSGNRLTFRNQSVKRSFAKDGRSRTVRR
jgi:hypothetical protein